MDKNNENGMQLVGQWVRKIGWKLSKHELHQITSVNTNDIKLFKIGQWEAGFRQHYKVIDTYSFHLNSYQEFEMNVLLTLLSMNN